MARTNHISTSASSYSFLDSQNTGDSVFSKDTTIGTTEQLTNSPLFHANISKPKFFSPYVFCT